MTLDEQLTVDLWLLDALLTGRDPRSGRGDENKIISMEDFLLGSDKCFYLSDGGYSRICAVLVGDGENRLFLTDNSRPAVKSNWDDHHVKLIRQRIDRHISEFLRA